MTIIIDSSTSFDDKSITYIKDDVKIRMFDDGTLEHEDTPLELIGSPKLMIHHKNEFPSFYGQVKQILTIEPPAKPTPGVVDISLKVNYH